MSTPVPLPQFTVQQYIEEAQSPDPTTSGANVNVQPLPIVATFTPSVLEAEVGSNTPPFTVFFDPVEGRVDTDGKLKGLNSNPVYYQNGSTINPVPANATAVFTDSHDPHHWLAADGVTIIANPAGTPVYGVRLVCGATMFNLDHPLTYRVDYSKGRVALDSFRFQALAVDGVVDLSTVTRLPL
jgi:hypothetical protein